MIKGSVIAANQTAFPFSIDSFPPLSNSEVSSALHQWEHASGRHGENMPYRL